MLDFCCVNCPAAEQLMSKVSHALDQTQLKPNDKTSLHMQPKPIPPTGKTAQVSGALTGIGFAQQRAVGMLGGPCAYGKASHKPSQQGESCLAVALRNVS